RNVYDLIQSVRRKYNIKREIKIAFDEWNVWYPEAKPPLLSQFTSVKDAVFTAGVLNALRRLCNEVPIAAFTQTVNVLPLILASNDGRMVLTPQYLVFKMYGENTGDNVLPAVSDSPLYKSSELGTYIPFIDASATITKDGKTLYLHLVNRHDLDAAHLQVSFRGYKPVKGCMQIVAGESVESKNTFENPNAVKIEKGNVKVENDNVILELKPHSVNIVKLSGESTASY
ncbi:hypothetical protein KEJ17_05415, partial [Candidatus Bathyarchaeota archaeon]|nr:hypothetical protein [Candidatus Bathyarchaeota archaeon]